jgi:hypothetical protein
VPLAAYPAVLDRGSVSLGVVGLVLLLVALLRPAAALVPWGLAALGGAYGLALVLADADLDAPAGFVAAGLLLVGELAFWSAEAGRWPREESAAARSRAAGMLVLALATATIGTLLVAAGATAFVGGPVLQAAGVLGAVAALALLALLAARRLDEHSN